MSAIQSKGAELHALNISNLQTDIRNWKGVISNPASTPADIDNARKQIKSAEKKIEAILKT